MSFSRASTFKDNFDSPQEVRGLLEVGTNGEDLVDQILHANNSVLAEGVLDDRVVSESDALLLNFSISALVYKLANSLEVGVSVCNPWLNDFQHLESGLGHAHEDTIVDLEETEELKNFAWLWCDLVDTESTLVEHEGKAIS
jgi:hypothetical protein